MDEQLLLGGGFVTAGPPPVPSVVFHESPHRRRVGGEGRRCAHCVMNCERWRRDPKSIPQWRTKADIIILGAVVLITYVDGAALELCGQHDRAQTERENHHG